MSARFLTPEPGTRACYHCAAWRPWGDIGQCDERGRLIGRVPVGQCRVAPPTIDPNAISIQNAAWPVVHAEDWCLAFRRRGLDTAKAEHSPDGQPHEKGRPSL